MRLHHILGALILSVVSFGAQGSAVAEEAGIRPPSVPLVACDPYFSIWSPADRLADAPTRHWTGRPHRLTCLARIGDRCYRVMGDTPANLPAMAQVSVQVLPTRTEYLFRDAGVELKLTFLTASLPDDLMVLSRPVTYLVWEARCPDNTFRPVSIYFDADPEITVNEVSQEVVCDRPDVPGLKTLRAGSVEQQVLAKKGDDLRIDWGHLYVAAPDDMNPRFECADRVRSRAAFVETGSGPVPAATGAVAASSAPVLAFTFDCGSIGDSVAMRWLMLAYDDELSIQLFRQNLKPYWRKDGADAAQLLAASARDFRNLRARCAAFDAELTSDLAAAGGPKYAEIGALAYRQCLAGCKLAADPLGKPVLFPKENTSNGCIGTVDVMYPMAPQLLLLSPALTRAMLAPILEYAGSPRWKFPFAPHDLGTYPLANAQVYGGGERTEENQMPVEESGNMLILLAALAQNEGNASFASHYWPVVRKWADYLRQKGFDPEKQLCTDDFAGHLAHNVNLSAKAIVALGAYGRLCQMRGDATEATEYTKLAREFAARWIREAQDGDHFRLTFNGPGTWSQKYNLVWDRILGLKLFPESVARTEMAFYRKHLDAFGLALDNRQPYAKTDWSMWTATLTGKRDDFEAILGPVYRYLDETPDRQPMNDLYWTRIGREVGMHARPVVGGVFLPMLYDRKVVRKYNRRDKGVVTGWAPVPALPVVQPAVPAADREPAAWRYTTARPSANWFAPEFDSTGWKEGLSGFGSSGTPGGVIHTEWTTGDIWLRREIDLPNPAPANLAVWMHHDEDAEVYLNGILACTAGGLSAEYDAYPIAPAALAALKPGRNVIAIHCHQTTGGQYIDAGLVTVR